MKYKKHIFICTNERKDGSRPSCGEEHGMALVKEFKKQIKEHGLKVEMRAQKTGCIDICEYGPNVVMYPEGIFYGNVQLSDVNEIVTEHLINNQPVKRLIIDFSKPGIKEKGQGIVDGGLMEEGRSDEIDRYRLDLVLIKETADRIIKDFDLFGFEITFSGEASTAYEELKKQLIPVFEKLLSSDKQKLMRMIYIIDIPEEKLNAAIKKFPNKNLAEIISHLVIEREFQKVITRRYYSKKE